MTRIANVHSFAVTAIDFNSRGTVVLSGSADGTVALIKVPEKPDTRFRFVHLMMIVVLIVILLMAFMEHNEGDEL